MDITVLSAVGGNISGYVCASILSEITVSSHFNYTLTTSECVLSVLGHECCLCSKKFQT